jgi:uncharacterized damage-inducible protein DinB
LDRESGVGGKDEMTYDFLWHTYETERAKVLSVWSMFADDDLAFRPHPTDKRGRSVREHMVHQCLSENLWFLNMFAIDVGAPPLPSDETRLAFIERYAEDSSKRLKALLAKPASWWEAEVPFFETLRSKAWIMVRRVAHTAHQRGQQTALLRALTRDLHRTYGPTADTGGLMQSKAPTIYAYEGVDSLISCEASGGAKTPLPGPGTDAVTERG